MFKVFLRFELIFKRFDCILRIDIEQILINIYYSGVSGDNGQCTYKKDQVVAHISGFEYATKNLNETQMQEVLTTKGPLSICVDAETWQYYEVIIFIIIILIIIYLLFIFYYFIILLFFIFYFIILLFFIFYFFILFFLLFILYIYYYLLLLLYIIFF